MLTQNIAHTLENRHLRSVQLGSVMGAVKIEHQGPQNHTIDLATIGQRYQGAYGDNPLK